MRIRTIALGLLISVVAQTGAADERASTAEAVAREREASKLFDSRQYEAALRLYEIGAKAGRPRSLWGLSSLYFNGHGVAKDLKKGVELATEAANKGFAEAQTALGWSYLTGEGATVNYDVARQWLVAASQQGEPRAMMLLGEMYRRGYGVKQDMQVATSLLRRAAELGEYEAANNFARLLLTGPREKQDPKLALHYLRKAATGGNARAAYNLSRVLLARSELRDDAQAAQWMSRAAEANYEPAALWLSELYAKGVGVPKDASRAAQLRTRALASASVRAKNDFAWELAVSENESLRNGALAVEIMRALLAEPSARRPNYIDTLAAAYAEAGDFSAAVKTQQDAIDALAKTSPSRTSVLDMQARLDAYRARQAYREREVWR